MNSYILTLKEAVFSTVLPTLGEPTVYAMQGFGGYSMPLAVLLAAVGVALGGLLMWGLGRVAAHFYLKNPNARYLRLYDDVHKRWVWTLLFAFSPLGFALGFGAGLFRIHPAFAAALMFGGALTFYGWRLLA